MKHSIPVLFISLLLVAGCTTTRETRVSDVQLEIIRTTTLPPLTPSMYAERIRLNLLLHVLQDGSVESVKLLGSSGDSSWDAGAIQSIKEWQFSVPRRNGVPTDIWARQVVTVQIEEPMVMILGKLVANNAGEADSLFALLRTGVVLDARFKQSLETVDITTYPKRVRSELKHLDDYDISRPIRLGDSYVIFKRFPKPGHNPIPG